MAQRKWRITKTTMGDPPGCVNVWVRMSEANDLIRRVREKVEHANEIVSLRELNGDDEEVIGNCLVEILAELDR